MKWGEIRKHYPNRWLLVEAIQAHTEGEKRIIEDLSVLDTFDCSQDAMHAYSHMHKQEPDREMLVLHTDREELDVTVKRWAGLRGAV